ncbi:MAG: hypothetical protein RL226_2228 [Bacteroidota bacterium]|jgi:dTDP-4-amino-4,6-dideoxygalactose transaminase
MNVPFVDLHAQYLRYKQEIDAAIASVIADTAFISGKYAALFEQDFARYTQNEYVIACGNGTDSLEILLDVYGVGPGDEVIVPAMSWFSTSETIGTRGATPVFVDVDEFFTIDIAKIEEKITENTRGIIPVHLYGCAANMPEIMKIAERHNLFVIEDCAQAHGAEFNGKRVATFGDAASFSFYPGKNLGAYGDAGAMTTNDAEVAEIARMIANHGQPKKHDHQMEGRNSRLDGLHGAILSVKLPYVEQWTAERRAHAALYNKLLADVPVRTPSEPEGGRHVYHLYVIRCKDRSGLAKHLESKGISTAIHYPTPLPFLPCYGDLGHQASDFPVAAEAAEEILSLPMYAELTEEQIAYVASSIQEYYA